MPKLRAARAEGPSPELAPREVMPAASRERTRRPSPSVVDSIASFDHASAKACAELVLTVFTVGEFLTHVGIVLEQHVGLELLALRHDHREFGALKRPKLAPAQVVTLDFDADHVVSRRHG